MIELNETKLRDLLISKFTILFDNPRELKLFRNFIFSQSKIKNKFFKMINYDNILFNLEEKYLFTMYFIYDSMLHEQNLFSNIVDFDNKISNKLNSKDNESLRGKYVSNFKYSKIKNYRPNLMEIFLFIYNNPTTFIEIDQFKKIIDKKNLKEFIIFKGDNFDVREFILLYKDTIMILLSDRFYSNKKYLFKLFDLFFSKIFKIENFVNSTSELFFNTSELDEILLDLFIELIDYDDFRLYLTTVAFEKSNLLSFNFELEFRPAFEDLDFTNSIIKYKIGNLFNKLVRYFENEIRDKNPEDILYIGISSFYPILELFNFDELGDYIFENIKFINDFNSDKQVYLDLIISNYKYYKLGYNNIFMDFDSKNYLIKLNQVEVEGILNNIPNKFQNQKNIVIKNTTYFQINLCFLSLCVSNKMNPIAYLIKFDLDKLEKDSTSVPVIAIKNDNFKESELIEFKESIYYDFFNKYYLPSKETFLKLNGHSTEDFSDDYIYDNILFIKYIKTKNKPFTYLYVLHEKNIEQKIPILKEFMKK